VRYNFESITGWLTISRNRQSTQKWNRIVWHGQ